MMHRYSIGQVVYFEGALKYNAARGQYKIVRLVPVERDNKVVYRIKNSAEAFERTAEEYQLTLAPALRCCLAYGVDDSNRIVFA